MLHLYNKNTKSGSAQSSRRHEMIQRIESNPNFCEDINAQSFNHYLFRCAKIKAKLTENIVAIGPSHYQDYFNLHGGRLYAVKFTFKDKSNPKKTIIKIDHRNSLFITPEGELMVFDTDKIHIIAGLVDKHREKCPQLKSELMGAIEPKKPEEVDSHSFLTFPSYHENRKTVLSRKIR